MRGVILAGGEARRFDGRPKGLERVGGERIVDRLARLLREATGGDPLLVANDPAAATWGTGLELAADPTPGAGALGGLEAAVLRGPAPVVVVAWDMPFVTPGLLRALIDHLPGADAVLPASGGRRGMEPLCAAYGPACAPAIAAAIARGDRRAIAFHPQVRVHLLSLAALPAASRPPAGVDPFFNVNTPADLAEARALWPQFDSSPSSGTRTPERPR